MEYLSFSSKAKRSNEKRSNPSGSNVESGAREVLSDRSPDSMLLPDGFERFSLLRFASLEKDKHFIYYRVFIFIFSRVHTVPGIDGDVRTYRQRDV